VYMSGKRHRDNVSDSARAHSHSGRAKNKLLPNGLTRK
jgi:hypothetical protein